MSQGLSSENKFVLLKKFIDVEVVRVLAASELKLIPKASSTGAEGTMFYDSGDDHVYVATE